MSISISQLFDWIRYAGYEAKNWADANGRPPRNVFISKALYARILQSPTVYASHCNSHGVLEVDIEWRGKKHSVALLVAPEIDTYDPDTHVIVVEGNESIIDYITERELLCATTGVSIADTVTTSEKTKSEE